MQRNIRKGHLAEIYSGMAKLLSHTALGVQIEIAPGRVRAVGTNYGETLVYEAESPESENWEGFFVLPAEQLKEIVSAYGSDTNIAFTEDNEGAINFQTSLYTPIRESPDRKGSESGSCNFAALSWREAE